MKIDAIIRSKRKTIALIIQPDGRLIIRAPLRVSERQIRAVVAEKNDWIERKLAEFKKHSDVSPAMTHQFKEGERFFFLGQPYILKWVDRSSQPLQLSDCFYLDSRFGSTAANVFAAWYRSQARLILTEQVALYANRFKFQYRQVRITSARTRWGSCSSSGAISFPWRLVMAPLPVIDYVVVHELVHTVERNHARSFWEKVAAIVPDYKEKRNWLKQNGSLLSMD